MILLYILLLVVCFPQFAHSEDFICGYDVVSVDRPALFRYIHSIDPSKVPACPAPYPPKILIPEAQVEAQLALYSSVPQKYLKVVGGLMVEMTSAEKALVDKPGQDKDAAEAVAKNEMATNEVCANHTLTEITAYWKGPNSKQKELQDTIATMDTAIAATPAGNTRTALTKIRDGVAAHMTMFINDSELQWRYICSHGYITPLP